VRGHGTLAVVHLVDADAGALSWLGLYLFDVLPELLVDIFNNLDHLLLFYYGASSRYNLSSPLLLYGDVLMICLRSTGVLCGSSCTNGLLITLLSSWLVFFFLEGHIPGYITQR
jgi:hypothetical protein